MSIDKKVLEKTGKWLTGDDTSPTTRLVIATAIGFIPMGAELNHEWCVEDFGRCYRLIEAIPEVAELSFNKLQNLSPHWNVIIAFWVTIAEVYEEDGSQDAFDFIKQLIARYVKDGEISAQDQKCMEDVLSNMQSFCKAFNKPQANCDCPDCGTTLIDYKE